jgi:hypothetical protein
MQYWIFFIGGVGGDGFSNLLEHANNITPADGYRGFRNELSDNGKVRFGSPQYASNPAFLKGWDYDNNDATLNPFYVNLVNKGINTVIPTHPNIYIRDIGDLECKDILKKDQFKICLFSKDKKRVFEDFVDKLRDQDAAEKNKKIAIAMHQRDNKDYITTSLSYNCFIDIEKVWRDWNYLDNMLKKIEIDLSEDVYREYLRIAQRP